MTISVLIPAYRAGRFLEQTLCSALAQSYDDIRVHVHIDPSDADGSGAPEDTLRAIEPFRSDPRLRVRRNPQRLGWDGNTRSLLHEVDTPCFAILPHDDLWDPDYLEVLHGELTSAADASVAYCDLLTFDCRDPFRRGVRLPRGGSLRAQLLAFLLEGAEAMPWRGVTRSALLPRIGGFPVDEHQGFAVECEYALSLLLTGTAIHVPRTMYHKRLFPTGAGNASRQRHQAAPDALRRAWNRHAARMEALLRDGLRRERVASDGSDPLLLAALTAAMLRRYQHSVGPVLEPAQQRTASRELDLLGASAEDDADAVRSRLHLVLSRHARAVGDEVESDRQAELATGFDPAHHEAQLHMAASLQGRGKLAEALACIARVEHGAPDTAGVARLRRQLHSQVA
jgi:hypothetical protein